MSNVAILAEEKQPPTKIIGDTPAIPSRNAGLEALFAEKAGFIILRPHFSPTKIPTFDQLDKLHSSTETTEADPLPVKLTTTTPVILERIEENGITARLYMGPNQPAGEKFHIPFNEAVTPRLAQSYAANKIVRIEHLDYDRETHLPTMIRGLW